MSSAILARKLKAHQCACFVQDDTIVLQQHQCCILVTQSGAVQILLRGWLLWQEGQQVQGAAHDAVAECHILDA